MARILEAEIERIKQEVSLEKIVRESAIELKPQGDNLFGLCPFHPDTNPSLSITPSKGLFHCFGCNAAGSVIDWVKLRYGLSFRHAIDLLRRENFSLASLRESPVKKTTAKKLSLPIDLEASDEELLGQVSIFYHQTIKTVPEAEAYLETRGLNSTEMIDHFKIGYSNRTLGYQLPDKNRLTGAKVRGRLQQCGIFRASGHEHFAGSIVIPIFNQKGEVTEIYGRKITPNLRDGTPLHLYLPGPHKGVWNRDALSSYKEVILCEALIDALSFWSAGFKNVTASYGVNGFTDEHMDTFKEFSIERVFIAYDKDEAGDRAAHLLAKRLKDEGIKPYRIEFPAGMDANQYLLKMIN